MSANPEQVARLIAAAVAQGHPAKVTDQTALAKVAGIIRREVAA